MFAGVKWVRSVVFVFLFVLLFMLVGITTFTHSSYAMPSLLRNVFLKAPFNSLSLLRSFASPSSSLRMNPYCRSYSTLSVLPLSPDVHSNVQSVTEILNQKFLEEEYAGSMERYFPIGNPVECRKKELKEHPVEVLNSQSLDTIYLMLKAISRKFTPESARTGLFSDTLSNIIVEPQLRNSNQFTEFQGAAPIFNGTYFHGTARVVEGGKLGDLIVDFDSDAFKSSKKELERLLNHTPPLAVKEVVSQITKYIREMVMHNPGPSCEKLDECQKITRSRDVALLSDYLFLGYGDCRPHSLTLSALLNHYGIKSEFLNLNLMILRKNKKGKWHNPQPYDHALVLYTAEDGRKYIADSYINEFNHCTIEQLKKGRVVGDKLFMLGAKHAFPKILVPTRFVRK